MASRYWVGGTSSVWDGNVGTKWSTTSGGAGGASVPTAADDVIFDANSPNCTLNASFTGNCRSIDFTGGGASSFPNTWAWGSSSTLNVGDTSGAGGGDVTFTSGMTLSIPGSGPKLQFVATGSGTQNLTTAGKTMPQIVLNGSTTNTLKLLDDVVGFSTAVFGFTVGKLDTNSKNVSGYNQFSSNNSNTRTLTLGSTTWTIASVSSPINFSVTGLTITANTATFVFTAANAVLGPGTVNYNGVTFDFQGGGTSKIGTGASPTVGNVIVRGTSAILSLAVGQTLGVTGTLTFPDATSGTHCTLNSQTSGSTGALYLPNGALVHVDVKDVQRYVGAASGIDATNDCADLGNNTGVDFGPGHPYVMNAQTAPSLSQATITFTAYAPAAGATLLVSTYNASRAISSITDSWGNTYTQIDALGTGEFWYCPNAATGSPSIGSVIVTFAGTAAVSSGGYYELRRVDAASLDQHTVTSGSSAAPNSGASGTTTRATELVFGWVASASVSTPSPGSGYVSSAGNRTNFGMEWKLVASTGTQTANFTTGTVAAWTCGVATFMGEPTQILLNASSGASSTTLALTTGSGATPQTIPLDATSALASSSLATTALTQVPLGTSSGQSLTTASLSATTKISPSSSSAVTSTLLGITAPTQIPLSVASDIASTSLGLTASTRVPLNASAAQALTTATLSATTKIPLNASSAAASPTLSISALTQIPLGASSAALSPTLALSATTQIPFSASSGLATTNASLKAQTLITLGAASGISSDSLAMTAQTIIPLGASSGIASTIFSLSQVPTLALSSSGLATTLLTLTAPTGVSSLISTGASVTSLGITAPTRVPLNASGALGATSLSLSAQTIVPLAAINVTASDALSLSATTRIALTASGVSSTILGLSATSLLTLVSGALSSTNLGLTASPQFNLTSSGTGSSTLNVFVPVNLALGASDAISSSTLSASAVTRVVLDAINAISDGVVQIVGISWRPEGVTIKLEIEGSNASLNITEATTRVTESGDSVWIQEGAETGVITYPVVTSIHTHGDVEITEVGDDIFVDITPEALTVNVDTDGLIDIDAVQDDIEVDTTPGGVLAEAFREEIIVNALSDLDISRPEVEDRILIESS